MIASDFPTLLEFCMLQSQQQVTPNVLCFSGALLSLRGLRSAECAWRMATELVQRMDMARVAMDVAGTQHGSFSDS